MYKSYRPTTIDTHLDAYNECVKKIEGSPLPIEKQEQMLDELHNVLSCLDNSIGPLLLQKQIQIIEKDIVEFIMFT